MITKCCNLIGLHSRVQTVQLLGLFYTRPFLYAKAGAYTEKMKGGFLKIAREALEKILLINIHLFMIMRTRDDNGLRDHQLI